MCSIKSNILDNMRDVKIMELLSNGMTLSSTFLSFSHFIAISARNIIEETVKRERKRNDINHIL